MQHYPKFLDSTVFEGEKEYSKTSLNQTLLNLDYKCNLYFCYSLQSIAVTAAGSGSGNSKKYNSHLALLFNKYCMYTGTAIC
jgi:hypothetical protein